MVRIRLPRGTLVLEPAVERWPHEALLGYAERINPKRPFLFVSKVLGRHIPAPPARIRQAFTELAALVPSDLPEPVLVLGLAETATGLGAGVHQQVRQRYPEALFSCTTRHIVNAPEVAAFTEEHSHAPHHRIYGSPDPRIDARARSSRSLIVVDDEATTGRTLEHTVTALRQAGFDRLTHVVAALLADWSEGFSIEDLRCRTVSLVRGRWAWRPASGSGAATGREMETGGTAGGGWTKGAPEPAADPAPSWFETEPILTPESWGRLPIEDTCSYVPGPEIEAEPGESVLVLGSGEYVWPPFLLAERLAARGASVVFGATTRSPIATGLAIRHCQRFDDNYGLGISNFVYNVDGSRYDRIFLCVETSPDSIDPALLRAFPQLSVISPDSSAYRGPVVHDCRA